MNLFGRSKSKQQDSGVPLREAIGRLKKAAEDSQKREALLERERENARVEGSKKLKLNDKKGAMFYLQRMRALEKELQSLYGKRSNLDTLVLSLESASFDRTIIEAISAGHKATQSIAKDEDVDRVQDMVAELQDSMRAIDEMSSSLSEPISTEIIDEDELLTAFEQSHMVQDQEVSKQETKQEAKQEEAKVAQDVEALPSAPSTTPKVVVTEGAEKPKQKDSELKRLEQLMSL